MKEELQSTINEAKARVYDAILELYKKTGLVITDVKMNYDQDGVNHWFNTWMVDFKIDRA